METDFSLFLRLEYTYYGFSRCHTCLVYYVALPTLQAFHSLDNLYSCLSNCKVLAMPDHRPHAPYVDVPKWERRMVIVSSLALFLMELEIYLRNYFKSDNDFSSCFTIPSALKYFPKSSTASLSS